MSCSWLGGSPAPAEVPLLSSVLTSLAFSASFSGLFFSPSGLISFLTGRMLPGEGGRVWAEETLEEPGGEVICLGVPGKKGKDFDACLCNQRVTMLVSTYTSLLQPSQLKIKPLLCFSIKQDCWHNWFGFMQNASLQLSRCVSTEPNQEGRNQIFSCPFPFSRTVARFF